MKVYLIDGTYELFRHHFGAPSQVDANGAERGAVVGVLGSLLGMIEGGVTHLGVATDHIVESFRNELWPGYKTGEGLEPELWNQFHPLEDALRAMGVVVWAMEELEADDGLAAAAVAAAADRRVEQVVICTPDKDLSQCVFGDRIVQLDRRKRELRDETGVQEKFGVLPASIPDWLALVGDSADGFPGVKGWGAKSSARVLARYHHLEAIPRSHEAWDVPVRGAARLATNLAAAWDDALLFRKLATLRTDARLFDDVEDLRWSGPTPRFEQTCDRLGVPRLYRRALSASSVSPGASSG